MYIFFYVYYSINIPDSFVQCVCVVCYKECGDFHQAAVYVVIF